MVCARQDGDIRIRMLMFCKAHLEPGKHILSVSFCYTLFVMLNTDHYLEAIAQYTNRPLLSLTVADLGLTEEKLEAQMTKWFQVATHWGAVLLIDEADVFLEKRKGSEVGRNSLVSRKYFLTHFPELPV